MCTLTILRQPEPHPDHPWLVRVVCNRDERRTRPAALPPERLELAGAQALMPIDPESGGTWLAVTDAGLILALLNSSEGHNPAPPRSRGDIVPSLIAAESWRTALEAALRFNPSDFAPFRLLILDQHELHVLRGNGSAWTESSHQPLDRPLMFASSGLGDALVEERRGALFSATFSGSPTAQDRFHRHAWPADRPHSVLMSRADARTVSITTMELGVKHARVSYQAVTEAGAAAEGVREQTLARRVSEGMRQSP